jgi:hypothetical protein
MSPLALRGYHEGEKTMRNMRSYVVFSIVVMSVVVCGLSFAQSPQTDIPVHSDLQYQAAESAAVLAQAQAQFDWIIAQFDVIKADPTLNLSDVEKMQLDKTRDMIQARKDRLEYVDVYFMDPSASTSFDDVYAYYNDPGLGLDLEDLISKASQVASEQQGETLVGVVNLVPAVLLADAPKQQLVNLINAGTLQAFAGGAGASRMSLTTVFMRPNAAEPANPAIEERTVVIIATNK